MWCLCVRSPYLSRTHTHTHALKTHTHTHTQVSDANHVEFNIATMRADITSRKALLQIADMYRALASAESVSVAPLPLTSSHGDSVSDLLDSLRARLPLLRVDGTLNTVCTFLNCQRRVLWCRFQLWLRLAYEVCVVYMHTVVDAHSTHTHTHTHTQHRQWS